MRGGLGGDLRRGADADAVRPERPDVEGRRPAGALPGNGAGGGTAVILGVMLGIVVAAGMVIDFLRQETVRSGLQEGLDRGVVAAATLDAQVDAETTLRDYIRFTARLDEDVVLAVETTERGEGRRVHARASVRIRTYFLQLVGVGTLDAAAEATAEWMPALPPPPGDPRVDLPGRVAMLPPA